MSFVRNRPLFCTTRKNVIMKCSDFVQDRNENTFYIYFLGRFHNKPIYTYGETTNLSSVEFALYNTLPYVEKVVFHPTEHIVYGKEYFSEIIKDKQLNACLPVFNTSLLLSDEFFTTTSEYTIDVLKDLTNDLFAEYKETE